MKQNVYVVVGLYNLDNSLLHDVAACLKQKGEVNVIDLPTPDSLDKVDREEDLIIHRYACSDKLLVNVGQRAEEIVRDIIHLGASECYLDYGVKRQYKPILRYIYAVLKTYGIKAYRLNRFNPFRWVRNIVWDIQFWLKEFKLQSQEEKELEQVEVGSGHGSMHGFTLYKKFEAEREERKRLHELRKQS